VLLVKATTGEVLMDIRMLGPLEGWRDSQPVDLGPPQQRAVLAMLALNINRVVAVDRLIAVIWAGHPPRTARNALQASVSRLRGILAADPPVMRIHTRPPGYVLEGNPGLVDVHRFTALVQRAARETDEDRVANLLRQALKLWRGQSLADLPVDGVRRLCRYLDESRRAVEARLRLGVAVPTTA
jgi:DNA-binding SARP family transcriptional activator